MSRQKVLVVGAGVCGLTVGHELAKALGADVLGKISLDGMRAYFGNSSSDTKRSLAPLIEVVNETMQGLRGNEFGPRHRQ